MLSKPVNKHSISLCHNQASTTTRLGRLRPPPPHAWAVSGLHHHTPGPSQATTTTQLGCLRPLPMHAWAISGLHHHTLGLSQATTTTTRLGRLRPPPLHTWAISGHHHHMPGPSQATTTTTHLGYSFCHLQTTEAVAYITSIWFLCTCNLVGAWGDIGHGRQLSLMRHSSWIAVLHLLVSEGL